MTIYIIDIFFDDEIQETLSKKFDYLRRKHKDISMNTKEVFKHKGYNQCRVGENIFALDVNLRPCMLRRNYIGLNLRKYVNNHISVNGEDIVQEMLANKIDILPQKGTCPGAKL
ncbi:hypothetical protein [Tepidimicrobium xylanilyticum]|uniref:Uncharacterized protein n=1 Tax=Tepidimicrobium xylanilyticum TaxID=1123352 RepID=A0A1H3EE69_9FIRM|nr:hypothetical protein [Tepidimicrobium xylanilyticum]GMG96599.1 hypothetical protein EN5CB1_14250 [Tepidimicrobium xylanilyticum]SDX77023.1 hypothetical protein SAMN05660923_02899 [Tepidimicrobium xylanilyticum]